MNFQVKNFSQPEFLAECIDGWIFRPGVIHNRKHWIVHRADQRHQARAIVMQRPVTGHYVVSCIGYVSMPVETWDEAVTHVLKCVGDQ